MKKIIVLLILIVALAAAGCAEQANAADEPVENAADANEEISTIEEPVPTVGPVLEIVTVADDYYNLIIKVRNTGDETAKNVHCGLMTVDFSNSKAFEEYMTMGDYNRYLWPAVVEGVSGDTYLYETEYRYKETPNMTIACTMVGIDYLGNIEPGEFKEGTVDAYTSVYHDDFLKIAWEEGNEENFAIY